LHNLKCAVESIRSRGREGGVGLQSDELCR